MQSVSTTYRDKHGKVLRTTPCTQPHPLGPRARDPLGRPYAGPFAGEWEPGSPDAPDIGSSRTARIIAAMAEVQATDAADWTTTGKPKVEAIERAFGAQISYHERDLVWRYLHPPAETPAAPSVVAAQASDIDARQSLIEGAIRRLDRDNKALWMPKGGKPRIEALEALVGGEVSAAERDAAWHIVSKE